MKKKNFREELMDRLQSEEAGTARRGSRKGSSEGDELPPSRARALLSKRALLNNVAVIQEKCGDETWLLPMVKANAYGHGAPFVVQALKDLKTLFGFGVATFEEAREVRESLGMRDRKRRVIVFSGSAHYTEEKHQFCEREGVEPVLHTKEDLALFLKWGGAGKVPYHLKFNTGMNRLGIPVSQAEAVLKILKTVPLEHWPDSICTHLATAEDPKDPLTLIQMTRFQDLRQAFRAKKETLLFHFANSSACWNAHHFQLKKISEIARPGLSLYGVSPFLGAGTSGLLPVMELQYQVLGLQDLSVGDRVGYGGTYRVSGKDHPNGQRIAIIGAGYADGISRMQSNQGAVFSKQGRPHLFLGRVSMDLSAIDAKGEGAHALRVGDWVNFLGEGIDPWTQAKSAGTIPYEILTSVSERVVRLNSSNR
jgi:alanine racemase